MYLSALANYSATGDMSALPIPWKMRE